MLDISARRQRKLIKKRNAISSATQRPALGVAGGTAKGEWTTALTTVSALFAIGFIAALSQGFIIFPGGLLLLWIVRELRPPRLLFVAPAEISVYSVSFWRGLPKDLVSTSALIPFQAQGSGHTATLGGEAIKMPKNEYARLVSLAATAIEHSGQVQHVARPASLRDGPPPKTPAYQ